MRTSWAENSKMRDWQPWRSTPEFVYQDEQTIQRHWFNLDTGARLCLMADGGWGEPGSARMRLYHRSPAGVDTDLSDLLDGARNGGWYEEGEESATAAYLAVDADCVRLVHELIGLDLGS